MTENLQKLFKIAFKIMNRIKFVTDHQFNGENLQNGLKIKI